MGELPKQEAKEDIKIEWGPEIGFRKSSGGGVWLGYSIKHALEEISKLNQALKEGEKEWRLPTEQELKKAAVENTEGFGYELPYWTSESKTMDSGELYPVRFEMYEASKKGHAVDPKFFTAYLKPCR